METPSFMPIGTIYVIELHVFKEKEKKKPAWKKINLAKSSILYSLQSLVLTCIVLRKKVLWLGIDISAITVQPLAKI